MDKQMPVDYVIGGNPGTFTDPANAYRELIAGLSLTNGASRWIQLKFSSYSQARSIQSWLATSNRGWDGVLDRKQFLIRTRLQTQEGTFILWVQKLGVQ